MIGESLGCSLEGQELSDRVGEWARLMARATSRRVEKGRIVSTYPREKNLLDQLNALIAAEAECCSFMNFRVEEQPDQVVVELSVPDEMSEALNSIGLLGVEPTGAETTS